MDSHKLPPPRTVQEYFSRLPSDSREVLLHLRMTIKAVAPEAEEVISYQIPAFRFHGILVYYAAFKDHCSLFIASPAVRRDFDRDLKPFGGGKGTVRFTSEKPLPDALVKRIVQARMAENEQKQRRNRAKDEMTKSE
jgi:uncharacterized protein YdhG (YjbR/CyaY superfamily)